MRTISFKLLHALGCLYVTSAEHTEGEAVFHYRLCWFNPLVGCGYVLLFFGCFPYYIYKVWRDFTKWFNHLDFTNQVVLPQKWRPRIGESYYYPAYNGKKFESRIATYLGLQVDADRWANEYIYRSLCECDGRCQQFNMILKYGKK